MPAGDLSVCSGAVPVCGKVKADSQLDCQTRSVPPTQPHFFHWSSSRLQCEPLGIKSALRLSKIL